LLCSPHHYPFDYRLPAVLKFSSHYVISSLLKKQSLGSASLHPILFLKPVDPAALLYQPDFSAGVKGMTVGTYLYPDLLFGRSGLNHVTTGAGNSSGLIFRVNFFFQSVTFFLSPMFNRVNSHS
jgi:hypothetical protein